MELNHYQTKTGETAKKYKAHAIPLEDLNGIWAVLDSSIATTYVAGKLKKKVFHGHNIFLDKRDFQVMRDYANQVTNQGITVPVKSELMQENQLKYVDTILGLVDESGEVAEALLRYLQGALTVEQLNKKLGDELGDVLWYLSRAAEAAGVTLEDVAQGNLNKLSARYPAGFSQESSKHRNVEKEVAAQELGLTSEKETTAVQALKHMKSALDATMVINGKIAIKGSVEEVAKLQAAYDEIIKVLED